MRTVRRDVLVVSHADADGHLIAEQTRRNLTLIPTFNVTTVIDPERTKDHNVWKKLEEIRAINAADIVFFVDLMFGPTTFAAEASALVDFVQARPAKRFFLVDHHPLPLSRLDSAENLRVTYRPEVFECAIGPRSGIMVVAALCEKQKASVSRIKRPLHELLALGMKRAAARGGPLPGEKLLALLRSDLWEGLAQLGQDDPSYHRLPRGRRPSTEPQSDTLRTLNETASELLADGGESALNVMQLQSGRTDMTYDFEATDRFNVSGERFDFDAGQHIQFKNSRAHPTDLEAIVTLMEVAALSLTTEPDATFTYEELVREVRELGGEEVTIEERDIQIVLKKAGFLKKVAGELRLR